MKSGYLFFIMALLVVFAIPLSADHALGNTVGEFPAISIINSEGDRDQDVSAPVFEVVAVKPDEIVIPLPKEVESAFMLNSIRKAIDPFGTGYTKYGGGRRIKSGRH